MDERRPDILFYSRDPGGTNVLVPMVKCFRELYFTEVYGKDFAVSIYKKEEVQCQNIDDVIKTIDEESMMFFLAKKMPRLVITGTSTIDRSEYLCWVCCKKLGIMCCANVDSWAFYKERFFIEPLTLSEAPVDTDMCFFPDYILAIDKEAKDEMEYDGIPVEKIMVAGYWHFLYQQEMIRGRNRDKSIQYREKLLNGRNERIVLFLSEGISDLFGEDPERGYGYHEKTIFSALEDSLVPYKTEEFILVVRPHPKEKHDWWNEKAHSSYMNIVIDTDTALLDQIQAADLVTGMQTQCLNDALLAGKPVISIQIGLNRKNPLYASRHGLIRTAFTRSSLEEHLNAFFSDNLESGSFEPDMSELDDFKEFIDEVIRNGRIGN